MPKQVSKNTKLAEVSFKYKNNNFSVEVPLFLNKDDGLLPSSKLNLLVLLSKKLKEVGFWEHTDTKYGIHRLELLITDLKIVVIV